MPIKDMTGEKCGRLMVICRDGDLPNGRGRPLAAWLCRCVCGKTVTVRGSCLRNGATKSCGCLWKDWSYSDRKHGFARKGAPRSAEYTAWASMKGRCHNKNDTQFYNYGGRGIGVCAAWRKSFAQFLSDMGRKPSPGHSLDRIDNSKDYSRDNCRWTTPHVQSRNRRRNKWVTVNGQSLIVKDWAKASGINKATIYARIRDGWPLALAVSTPRQLPGCRRRGEVVER